MLNIVVGVLCVVALAVVVVAACCDWSVTYTWKPEGDSEGVNWHRCKLERWENERRELERRVRDVPVDHERRSGDDRRKGA